MLRELLACHTVDAAMLRAEDADARNEELAARAN